MSELLVLAGQVYLLLNGALITAILISVLKGNIIRNKAIRMANKEIERLSKFMPEGEEDE